MKDFFNRFVSIYTNNKKGVIFVVKVALVYGGWKLFSVFFFDSPIWIGLKEKLAHVTTYFAYKMLIPIFKEDVMMYPRAIVVNGTKGIQVADFCLAIPAMVMFTAFIAIYSGKFVHKLWFIPSGLMAIFLINAFRIASLAYIQKAYSYKVFHFFHSYAYIVIVYGLIFLLVKFWMDKFDEA